MQLRIDHVTGFEYDGLVSASYNEARMTPQSAARQTVTHAGVEVSPHPWAQSYRDYWGTLVTAFEVLAPHRELTVTATSMVRTEPPATALPTTTWAELADAPGADVAEFLTLTDRVRPPADLADLATGLVADGAAPHEVATELLRLVHDEVTYLPGATDVHAEAATAWRQRSGVCQDIAHLALGALRAVGIPSRYVSGYLLPNPDPLVGEETHGESHAWLEWWADGWHAFDPTNDLVPGERHVMVAAGRDYADVRPLSGIYTGAATSRMFVDVRITRLG
ncbi:transglutaminase family protein [Nocardioides nitrophenolicus]|uniref:transglutaminase family protein n=1 Tax=Nocardioides nitrophenolicus TaxID=60489 RepID=UPI00195F2102|nr:transglutaminase family protein [Nocardioides nitrophenolicus]MBM7515050.1 transglutaminase-like putative cysteine protease [Nocardioides nitrophenolicus]